MTYEIKCVRCGEVHKLKLDIRKLNKWLKGKENIQNICPELPAADRELLLSQICGKCWGEMFGKAESEDKK